MADQNTQIKITATDQASAVFGKVAGEAGKLGGAVQSLGGSFAALGSVAVAGVSAISFASKIQDAINLADSFNKLSQKTGVAVEDLSKLNYAAGLADVSTEALSVGLKKLNVNISAAGNGSKEQAALFKALGVSVKDAAGNMRSADRVFADLADVFAGSADGANKTAIAVALLGKAGADLIPLLNGGKSALKDLGDEAKKLGIVLGADFAKNAEEFNDNLHKLQLSGQGLFVTLGGDLVKALGNAGKAAAEAAIEHGKLAGVIAGLQVLMTGDDQHKNNVALVKQTDELLRLEGKLAQLKGGGAPENDLSVQRTRLQIAGVKDLLATTVAYRDALASVNKEQDKAKPAPTKDSAAVVAGARAIAAPGVGATASAYDTINKSVQERIKLAQQELDVGRQLTDAEKFGIKITADMDAAKGKLSATQRAALEVSLKDLGALADRVDLQERGDKADLAAAQARGKYMESLREGLDKLKEEVQAQADHNAQLGLGAVAIAEMEAARLQEQASILDGIAIKNMDRKLDQAEYDAIKAKAAALRELAGLKVQGAIKEQGIEAAKAVNDEWKRGLERTDDFARDMFMTWATDGGNAAQKIGDALKSALLSAIYEATLKPLVFNIYSSLTGGGGGGNLLNTAMSAYSGKGMLGSVGSTVGGWLGFGGSSAAAATTAGVVPGGTGVLGAVGNNASAYVAGTGAAGGSGALGASFAGVPVVGWIAAGMAASANAFDKGYKWDTKNTWADPNMTLTDGLLKRLGVSDKGAAILSGSALSDMILRKLGIIGGESRAGGQYGYSFDGQTAVNARRGTSVAASGVGATFLEGPNGGDPAAQVVKAGIDATVSGIDELLKRIGSKARLVGFQAGYESSKEGRGGVFTGGTLSTGQTFGESGKGDNYNGTLYEKTSSQSPNSTDVVTNATTDWMQATVQALQAVSDGPKVIADMLKGVNAEALSAEEVTKLLDGIDVVVTRINNFRTAVESLPFEALKNLSFDAADGLIAAAGGLDVLGTNLASYYDNFYSAEEKRAQTVKNINAALAGTGFDAATATRADFRKLVDKSMADTSESGLKLTATLLSVNGAFASITDAADNAATAVSDAAKALQDAASTALDGLQRAVGADKDRLTAAYEMQASDISAQIDKVSTSVGKLQALSGTLKATLDGLRISGADGAYRQSAQAQISAALASARAGGALPLDGQLDNALRTVSQPSEQLFASFEDYARDFYRTANDIAALSDITGTQLSAEQLTQQLLESQLETLKTGFDKDIKRLDGILDTAKLQLDALNGIDTSIKSVADALAAFNGVAGTPKPASSTGGAPAGTGGVVVGGGVATSAPAEAGGGFWESINLMGTQTKHYIDDPERVADLTKLRDFINATFDGSKESLEQIKSMGGSQAKIAMASGYYLEDIQKLYEGVGIPAFAGGGTFAGGLRVVGENGPELEATGASRIWNSSQLASALTSGGASNAELVAELRAMRTEITALRAAADRGNESSERAASALEGRQSVPFLVQQVAA